MRRVSLVGVGIYGVLGVLNGAQATEISIHAERAFERAMSRTAAQSLETDQSTEPDEGRKNEPTSLSATAVSDASAAPRS
jgi:hypothetical protein